MSKSFIVVFLYSVFAYFAWHSTAAAESPVSEPVNKAEVQTKPRGLIEPYVAHYKANIAQGISLKGTAIRSLKKSADGLWDYSFDVDTLPAEIKESSRFSLQNGKIIPSEYHYLLSGFLIKDRKQRVIFDIQNNTLTENYKKDTWTLAPPKNILDRLNYQLQLQLDVARNAEKLAYEVIHKGKIREYTFKVVGEERIATAIGERDAVRVEKVRDSSSKRSTQLWFDLASPYALLRMVQKEEDGERYEINISKLD